MNIKWTKACQWMLGILGISATISSCDNLNLMRVEYGMPNMDYSVKGKVIDSKTGKGIKGIEVSHEPFSTHQTDTTGVDGSFEIHGNTWPEKEFQIELKDIDPEKDGSYASKIETVNLKQVKKGSGSWYSGAFEAEGVILKMDEDTKE